MQTKRKPIVVPRLAKGHGISGPEFYGCFNTGMAPSIFHSRTGKYVVGPELRCRDAMRERVTLTDARHHGDGNQRVWLYNGRKPAVAKFMAMCGAQILENHAIACDHAKTAEKAAKGDFAAALHLGDF